MQVLLEFPQFYPHSPDFTSIIINNFEKMSKIFGQNVRHTTNSASSQSLEQLKEYFSQSPVPAGLINVPLFAGLTFHTFQKIDRLALWNVISILELQFAETQANCQKFRKQKVIMVLSCFFVNCPFRYRTWHLSSIPYS